MSVQYTASLRAVNASAAASRWRAGTSAAFLEGVPACVEGGGEAL